MSFSLVGGAARKGELAGKRPPWCSEEKVKMMHGNGWLKKERKEKFETMGIWDGDIYGAREKYVLPRVCSKAAESFSFSWRFQAKAVTYLTWAAFMWIEFNAVLVNR